LLLLLLLLNASCSKEPGLLLLLPFQVKGKLEKDERWKLLPNDGERRLVFDEFCKNVAAEQKALAAAAEKQAVEGFK
jgi:hypothetical protein